MFEGGRDGIQVKGWEDSSGKGMGWRNGLRIKNQEWEVKEIV